MKGGGPRNHQPVTQAALLGGDEEKKGKKGGMRGLYPLFRTSRRLEAKKRKDEAL